MFLNHIYKFHGLSKIVVTDIYKIFIKMFRKELFKLLGQIERVNQCLEIYLRCMTMHNPSRWQN